MRTCLIYEDPITKLKLEGRAVLLLRHAEDTCDIEKGERWEVQFLNDDGSLEEMRVSRWLDPNDIERTLP